MDNAHNTIFIHSEAPTKPVWGGACNGCGVCCLAEPCPVGMVLSGRRSGACQALVWSEEQRIYRCGALDDPQGILGQRFPQWLQFAKPLLVAVLRWLGPRWISVGSGCDSTLEVITPSGRIRSSMPKASQPLDT